MSKFADHTVRAKRFLLHRDEIMSPNCTDELNEFLAKHDKRIIDVQTGVLINNCLFVMVLYVPEFE